MTPSEKKARDEAGKLLMWAIQTSKVKGAKEAIEEVASALSEAERRGFERAKELMLEELKTRDFIGPLTVRNLKYEEA